MRIIEFSLFEWTAGIWGIVWSCVHDDRAEQRDMLAAVLVEAAYMGVSGACSCRNLGAALPSLAQLIPLGRDLQHPQQLERQAHNGNQSVPSQGVPRTAESPPGTRSNGVQGSEAPHVAQHASPTVGSEAPGSSRKRPAEASPEASGSPFKRQQMERGMAAQLAVSSAAPAGNVASLMTNLEQEVRAHPGLLGCFRVCISNLPQLFTITQVMKLLC